MVNRKKQNRKSNTNQLEAEARPTRSDMQLSLDEEPERTMSAQPTAKRREREPDSNDEPPTRRRRMKDTDVIRPGESAEQEIDPSTLQEREMPHQISGELPQSSETVLDAVVKVFCVHSEPNFSLPWQRKRQFSSTSSGFIIEGRRILTNAHSVDHHCQVKVRRRGSDTKFIAKVLAQGPECDIALLTVENENFWSSSLEPVHFGALPRLQDSVSVVGFPIGGDTMSVTSGVVSRIETTSYSHSGTALLGMQIDAAINSGNSGGPAFNKQGECVGIAFQTLKAEDAENIGYVIPVDVVQHFITDFDRNGRFTNFPILGIEWQKLESPYLRKALKMKDNQKGILVREVEPTAPAKSFIQKGDVLLTFDGVEVANDGTVQFRSGERISFSYLVSRKFTSDTAVIQILRNGKELTSELKLSPYNKLVPEHLDNTPPPYYILAGFVFTQVTAPYLRSEYGKDYDYDSPVKLLDLLMHGKCQTVDDQVVVLGQVLAADCTVGYEDLSNYKVFEVNGTKIKNLRELVRLVEDCKEEYLNFLLEYNSTVIIDTKDAHAATKEIMEMHYVPHDRSVDLREPEVPNGTAKS